jgi:predicted Zn-dependent protease
MSNHILRRADKILAQKGWESACAYLAEAEASDRDPRVRLRRAILLLDHEHVEEACAALTQLIETQPAYVPARLYLGIALLEANKPREAAMTLKCAVEQAPQNELVRAYLGLAELMQGHFAEAQTIFSKSGYPANLGFLVRLTMWTESQWLEKGTPLGPVTLGLFESAPSASSYSRRAAIQAFRKKNYREFLTMVAPGVLGTSASVDELYACAIACEMLCAYEEALRFIERLAEKESNADPLLAARGRCLVRLGRYNEALECFERVLIVGPEDFGLNYYLGVLCLAHRQKGRSRDFFHRAYRDYYIDTSDYQLWQIQRALEQLFATAGSVTCDCTVA